MPDWGSLAAFGVTALAIMGSPGPATISLTAAGSAFGIRRSLDYLGGIVVGTTLVLVAVASGITVALLAVPTLELALIGVSVAYVLWLAFHIATAAPLDPCAAVGRAPSFGGGLLLGVANPKAWVALAAVYASAGVANDAVIDAAAKLALLTVLIVLINAAWLAAGMSVAPLLRDPVRARVVNVLLAASLVGATALAVVH
jgi:threonine/homoserine/homoserine lactone efflux protein